MLKTSKVLTLVTIALTLLLAGSAFAGKSKGAAKKKTAYTAKRKVLYETHKRGKKFDRVLSYDSIFFKEGTTPRSFLLFVLEMHRAPTLTLDQFLNLAAQWDSLQNEKCPGSSLYRKLWRNSLNNIPKTAAILKLYRQMERILREFDHTTDEEFYVDMPDLDAVEEQSRRALLARMQRRHDAVTAEKKMLALLVSRRFTFGEVTDGHAAQADEAELDCYELEIDEIFDGGEAAGTEAGGFASAIPEDYPEEEEGGEDFLGFVLDDQELRRERVNPSLATINFIYDPDDVQLEENPVILDAAPGLDFMTLAGW